MPRVNYYFLLVMVSIETARTIHASKDEDRAPESSRFDRRNSSCPVWFVSNGTDCTCRHSLDGLVHCDQETKLSSLLECYCMTHDNDTGVTVVGASLYCCYNTSYFEPSESGYRRLPQNVSELNEEMCRQFNRQGRLCGRCRDGYYPPVYSYDLHCLNCTYSRYNWIKFALQAFGPLTVFFIIVVTFSISPINPPVLAPFVFSCQFFSSPQVLRGLLTVLDNKSYLHTLMSVLASFYGIWNLDFCRTLLPPICLPLTTLQVLSLDYAIAFYPLVLIVAAYVLIELHTCGVKPVVWVWRPFGKFFTRFRRHWDLKTSIVDAFVTFLLLSFTKVCSVTFDILVSTYMYLYNVCGEHLETIYMYYDATVEYLSKEHLPYFILAMAAFTGFIALPLLLLLLYPCQCFQRCLTRSRIHSLTLKIFMDAFQGCYKDGTSGTGTRDCRFFAAVYIGARLILFTAYSLTLNVYVYSLVSMLFVVISGLFVIIQPYKAAINNQIDSVTFLVVALWGISLQAVNSAVLTAPRFITFSMVLTSLLTSAPLLYISGVFVYWLVCIKKAPQRVLQRLGFATPNWLDRFGSSSTGSTLPDRLVNPGQYERVLPDPMEHDTSSDTDEDMLVTY
jgi:hypothetical protein